MSFSCPAQFNQENSNFKWTYFKGGLHYELFFKENLEIDFNKKQVADSLKEHIKKDKIDRNSKFNLKKLISKITEKLFNDTETKSQGKDK